MDADFRVIDAFYEVNKALAIIKLTTTKNSMAKEMWRKSVLLATSSENQLLKGHSMVHKDTIPTKAVKS